MATARNWLFLKKSEDALIEEMQRLSFKNEETDPFTLLFLITDLDDYSDHSPLLGLLSSTP